MNELLNIMKSFFQKKKQNPLKIKVCWGFLAEIFGQFLFITKEDEEELSKLDDSNPDVLREIIREYIVTHYRYFPPENQEKIKNSLIYYLSTNSEKLERVFSSYYVPVLGDETAKLFYSLVWQELYGTDSPDLINPDDYEEDCSPVFFNSLKYSSELEKIYNPNGEKPSIANIISRLKQNS